MSRNAPALPPHTPLAPAAAHRAPVLDRLRPGSPEAAPETKNPPRHISPAAGQTHAAPALVADEPINGGRPDGQLGMTSKSAAARAVATRNREAERDRLDTLRGSRTAGQTVAPTEPRTIKIGNVPHGGHPSTPAINRARDIAAGTDTPTPNVSGRAPGRLLAFELGAHSRGWKPNTYPPRVAADLHRIDQRIADEHSALFGPSASRRALGARGTASPIESETAPDKTQELT